MKIVDITEFYSTRGGGVRSHLTLKGHVSCQLGHEHIVLAPGARDDDRAVSPESRSTNAGSARVITVGGPPLPYDPSYHLLWRIDKIHAIIKRERPDILEVHSPYVAAVAALTTKSAHFGARTFTWHADFIDTYVRVSLSRALPSTLVDFAVSPLWEAVRRISRGCSATFVASRWQKEKLRRHGAERVQLVPFGVARDVFIPSARSDERRRELLGDGFEDASLLIGVGRFAVEKQWDVVLRGFLELRKTRNAKLILFGDGPERAALESMVRGRNDVSFLGFETNRHRLASALASADALVHGCPFETFGFGIAEALCCGLPVVVPDQGGAFEFGDDRCAEVYESGNSAACARAMERILSRGQSALRDGALNAAFSILDARQHFERLFQIYGELRS